MEGLTVKYKKPETGVEPIYNIVNRIEERLEELVGGTARAGLVFRITDEDGERHDLYVDSIDLQFATGDFENWSLVLEKVLEDKGLI